MPINEPMQFETKEAKVYPPLPPDVYTCELLDVSAKTDLNQDNEPETKLNFQFTVLDQAHRVRNIWANYIPSYFYISPKTGKNNLYRILEAFLGRELSVEDTKSFNSQTLNSLIGQQCRVLVETGTAKKSGKLFDKAVKFLPVTSKLPSLSAEEKDKATVKNKPKEQGQSIDEISRALDLPEM